MILGLGHKARSGKDTAGAYLVKYYGFRQIAFADRLKAGAKVLFGLTSKETYDAFERMQKHPYWGDSPVEIFQKLGTECMREGYAEDFWIRVVEKQIRDWQREAFGEYWQKPKPQPNVVITDVRFPNEAEAIKSWGGRIYRIDRVQPQQTGRPATHISEMALSKYQGWDGIIANNDTLASLYAKLDLIMRENNVRRLNWIQRLWRSLQAGT